MPTHRLGAVRRSSPTQLTTRLVLSGLLLASVAAPAHAGWFDSLFGKSSNTPAAAPAQPDSKNRTWQLHDFTTIQLVAREAGSEANQQPVAVDPEALRQQLAAIQVKVKGDFEPLFGTSELAELLPPLTQALARATPADDIVVLSSDRRAGGLMGSPLAITARMFVQGGSLQLIVHDARQDFYDAYRGNSVQPKFVFGTRASTGSAVLQSIGASSRRADWLAIPMNVAGARMAAQTPAIPAPIGAAAPGGALPAPLAPVGPLAAPVTPAATMPAPVAVAPAPAAAVPVPAAATTPAPAAALSEPERRLETLKRLHSKGLITDEEFQEKRKEILKSL